MYKLLFEKFLQQFIKTFGRKPQTRNEIMSIQDDVVRYLNKTKGVPEKKPTSPFQGFTPKVIQGGKSKEGITSIPVNKQIQDLKTFEREVIDELNAPIKPDLEVIKGGKKEGLAGIEQRAQKIEDINKKLKTMQEEKTAMYPGSKDKTLFKDSPERIAKMKADNKAAAERLRNKKKTVEDFSDDGDFDPGGMASGGLARVGMLGGGLIKLAQLKKMFPRIHVDSLLEASRIKDPNKLKQLLNSFRKTEQSIDKAPSSELFNFDPTDRLPNATGGLARVGMVMGGSVWKKFIEGLFIKTSNNIRQGKGLFKGLNQEQMITQHDNLTKMLKKWEMSGRKGLPEGAEQFIGMNDLQVTKAIKGATSEVEINKVLNKAYDEVAGGSGFSDDYKMAADQLSDSIAEQLGKNFDDLSQTQQTQIQNIALKRTTQDLKTKLSQPKKTLEGIKKEGTIDISDPEVADEFSRFMKESDPKGYKDLEQKIELDDFDVTGRKKNASGGIAGQLHLNEGGRVPMIFGGSAGLKAMIKNMIEGINKGRKNKIKTLFPKYSVEEKELLKLGEKYLPRDAATLAARETAGKAEGVQVLIDRLKNDKKIIEQMAKNKAMNDPGLDFMMEKMKNMYPPNLKKYTDIDKDILQLETIKKNLIMKDRQLNAEGGRASLSNGGLANILGV